nr:uracil-DNA glycosylase [Sneathiella limimaris]
MQFTTIEPTWDKHLTSTFQSEPMQNLEKFLEQEYLSGKVILPPKAEIFTALKSTPLPDVKVVILGQDPYHGIGQAHGLAFSVKRGVPTPPSLKNIFKEISRDLGLPIPTHGNLQSWANQGVLLLNTVLTVEQGKAASHQKKGWERLTDEVIQTLNRERQNLVFFLWGNHAIAKAKLIDPTKHLVLTSVHPSPLSANRGFLGNGHFSATNNYLKEHGISPINWAITDEQQTLF